jgi:hypothetical protein
VSRTEPKAFSIRRRVRSMGGTAFALQVGGGIDMRIAYHFAMRAIQADWIRIQFPNGATNVQNTLRLGAGVVPRLVDDRLADQRVAANLSSGTESRLMRWSAA